MISIHCQCGETYHAEDQHVGHKIRCSRCGAVLLIEQGSRSSSLHSVTPEPDRKPKPDSCSTPIHRTRCVLNHKRLIVTCLVVLVLAGGLMLFLQPPNQETKNTSASQPVTRPTPRTQVTRPVVVEPENPNRLPLGAAPLGRGARHGNSTLAVDNGTDIDALVVVIRLQDVEQKIRNFYIGAGEKFSADKIPAGEYILRVAFGRDWDSNARKFNYRQSFSKTQSFTITENKWVEPKEEGYIEHTEASDMSITLHKVPFGNFKSYPINEEEFWR